MMKRRHFFVSLLGLTAAAAQGQAQTSLETATTRVEAKLAKQHDGPNPTDLGVVDGTNALFTLALSPIGNAAVSLYKNGNYLREGAGADFTLLGKQVTLAKAPSVGDSLDVSYWYLAFV